jgi:hypothetical protein
MSKRNKAVGPWTFIAQKRYLLDDETEATIIAEQADMLDTKLGHRYEGGSWRVRLINVPEMRTKTFYGEMAWCRAENHANDAADKCGDWRWPFS